MTPTIHDKIKKLEANPLFNFAMQNIALIVNDVMNEPGGSDTMEDRQELITQRVKLYLNDLVYKKVISEIPDFKVQATDAYATVLMVQIEPDSFLKSFSLQPYVPLSVSPGGFVPPGTLN